MSAGLATARRVLQDHRDRIYLIEPCSNRSYTYGEFASVASGLGKTLTAKGIRERDRVAILLPGSAEFALSYFAVLSAGAVAVPMNPQAHVRSLSFIFGRTRPSVVICTPETSALVPHQAEKIVVDVARTGDRDGLRVDGLADVPDLFARVRQEDFWSVNHTSGTTAQPKGVVHSAENLLGNAHAFNSMAGVGSGSRFLHVLPMYYMAGFLNSLLCPFVAGGSVVLASEFNPTSLFDFWSIPMSTEVNTIWLSPAMLAMLVRLDRNPRAPRYCSATIRHLFSATAPLTVKTKREFETKYGVHVRQSYGTSEQLLITLNDPGAGDREDAVGRQVPGVSIRLIDDGGNEVRPGETGEVFVSSPQTYAGYYDPESPSLVSSDGREWVPTGDLGVFAQSGELVITGRRKDLIIRGGVNISPIAVEAVLAADPNVDECVAVGVPNEILGEVVAVAFRPASGRTVDQAVAALKQTCSKEFASSERPSYLLAMTEFPSTVTGKVQRNKVRDHVIEHLAEAVVLR